LPLILILKFLSIDLDLGRKSISSVLVALRATLAR